MRGNIFNKQSALVEAGTKHQGAVGGSIDVTPRKKENMLQIIAFYGFLGFFKYTP